MMTIIGGGLVSFWGPILGVIFYFITRDIVGGMTEAWLMWFGGAFMLVILFQPEGIAGLWGNLSKRFLTEKPALPTVSTPQEAQHEPV